MQDLHGNLAPVRPTVNPVTVALFRAYLREFLGLTHTGDLGESAEPYVRRLMALSNGKARQCNFAGLWLRSLRKRVVMPPAGTQESHTARLCFAQTCELARRLVSEIRGEVMA